MEKFRKAGALILAAAILLPAAGLAEDAAASAKSGSKTEEKTASASQIPTIAVLPFTAKDRGADDASATKISDLVAAALMSGGDFDLVDRADLKKALDEQALSGSGMVETDSAVKIGKIVGAKLLVTGTVFSSGGKNYIVAKVIGTETTRVVGTAVSDKADAAELAPSLAEKLSDLIKKSHSKLLPPIVSRESVLKELSSKIKGAGRSVYLGSFGECSYDDKPIKTANAELSQLLLDLGFKIADSAKDADLKFDGSMTLEPFDQQTKISSVCALAQARLFDKEGKLLAAGKQREVMASTTRLAAGAEASTQAALTLAQRLLPAAK